MFEPPVARWPGEKWRECLSRGGIRLPKRSSQCRHRVMGLCSSRRRTSIGTGAVGRQPSTRSRQFARLEAIQRAAVFPASVHPTSAFA